MPNKIRAFIAVELEPALKDRISEIQSELKKTDADIKWVNPNNIHLTLKFLGYVEEKKLEEIKHAIEKIAKDFLNFSIETSQIGIFPEKGTPRVIWIGIKKGKEILTKIAFELKEEIAKLGIPKEDRPFQSHATIGRIKSSKNKDKLISKINEINQTIKPQVQDASEIILFQSTLSPLGPTYTKLYKANFK